MAHKAIANLRSQHNEQVMNMNEEEFEDEDDPMMHAEPSFGQP